METFVYVCMFAEGKAHTPWEKCWYRVVQQAQALPSLSTVYILSGPFSLLREPWFDLNKIILELVFPLGFFSGVVYPKILVFVCDIFGFLVYDSIACLVDRVILFWANCQVLGWSGKINKYQCRPNQNWIHHEPYNTTFTEISKNLSISRWLLHKVYWKFY